VKLEREKVPGASQIGTEGGAASSPDVEPNAIAAAAFVGRPDEGEDPTHHENGYRIDALIQEESTRHTEYGEELQQELEVADELEAQEPYIATKDEKGTQIADESADEMENNSLASLGDSDRPPETGDQAYSNAYESEHDLRDPSSDISFASVSEPERRIDGVKAPVHVGNDIEEMVNLLESVPVVRARPSSVASIPDDVHEIPDED
jgi:hypothetical protein